MCKFAAKADAARRTKSCDVDDALKNIDDNLLSNVGDALKNIDDNLRSKIIHKSKPYSSYNINITGKITKSFRNAKLTKAIYTSEPSTFVHFISKHIITSKPSMEEKRKTMMQLRRIQLLECKSIIALELRSEKKKLYFKLCGSS
jgi:hypothetical protein